MVDIGGRPVLWHIMKHFGHYGFRRFILCLGYKGWEIKRFFMEYRAHLSDFSISLRDEHRLQFLDDRANENSKKPCRNWSGDSHGSAIADDEVLHPHPEPAHDLWRRGYLGVYRHTRQDSRQRWANWNGYGGSPNVKYGEMQVEGDQVVEFNEKPTQVTGWVSGGYFMFEKSFLDDYLDDDPLLWLEHAPLQRLARNGQLSVNRHDGFWCGMDTFQDYTYLNKLWADGTAPWRTWEGEPGIG